MIRQQRNIFPNLFFLSCFQNFLAFFFITGTWLNRKIDIINKKMFLFKIIKSLSHSVIPGKKVFFSVIFHFFRIVEIIIRIYNNEVFCPSFSFIRCDEYKRVFFMMQLHMFDVIKFCFGLNNFLFYLLELCVCVYICPTTLIFKKFV